MKSTNTSRGAQAAVNLMSKLTSKEQERLLARLIAASVVSTTHPPARKSAVYRFVVEDHLDSYQLLAELDDDPPIDEAWLEMLREFALFTGDPS
jgi:hypothetical protein